MAWNDYANADEGKVSEFNAAALKMKRLDKLMDLLNSINGNLPAYNDEYAVYNFELKFSTCEALYQEVESKLTPKERVTGEGMRKALVDFIANNKVFKVKKKKVYPYTQYKILDKKTFAVLKEWLFTFETLVRQLIDEHGMDTKYYDDDEGL